MKSNWYSEKDWVEDLESVLLIILDYISMEGNKLWCFLNSKGLFKVQNTVHNIWTKFYTVEGFPWCTHAPKFSTRCTVNWISSFFSALQQISFLRVSLFEIHCGNCWFYHIITLITLISSFSFSSHHIVIFLLLLLSLHKLRNKTLCQEKHFFMFSK